MDSPKSGTSFNPYYEWLGIPGHEQIDHYRLLGLARFESNANVIANAYDAKMAFLRTKQLGPHSQFAQRLQTELAAAQRTLLDAAERASYNAGLQRLGPRPAVPVAPVVVHSPQVLPPPQPQASQPPMVVLPQPIPQSAIPNSAVAAADLRPLVSAAGRPSKGGKKPASFVSTFVQVVLGGLLAIPCAIGIMTMLGIGPFAKDQPVVAASKRATPKESATAPRQTSWPREGAPHSPATVPKSERASAQPVLPPTLAAETKTNDSDVATPTPPRPGPKPAEPEAPPAMDTAKAATASGEASPQADVAATKPAGPTDARVLWRYELGHFARQADGSWLQLVATLETRFREVARNEEFIELEQVGGPGHLRLYADRCDLKRGSEGEYEKFQMGKWESPPSAAPNVVSKTPGPKTPGRAALDEAIALHTRQLAEARDSMIQTFDAVIQKVRKDKSTSGTDKLSLISRLEVEKNAFEKAGYLPFSAMMLAAWPEYTNLANSAHARLSDAYEKQISSAVRESRDPDAEQLRKEREGIFKPTIIARWNSWVLYSDGTLDHPRWKANKWSLKNNVITLNTGERWTLNALGDKVDCVNTSKFRFKMDWQPPQ